jgi:hypothetical protein
MWQSKKDLLIRILPQTGLGRLMASFPLGNQPRGQSPHAIDFYA